VKWPAAGFEARVSIARSFRLLIDMKSSFAAGPRDIPVLYCSGW